MSVIVVPSHVRIQHVTFIIDPRAVNAGKSLRNEDQGRLHVGYLERESLIENGGEEETFNFDIHSLRVSDVTANARHRLPYVYFALFDGHAGTGAALSASHELHRILHVISMSVVKSGEHFLIIFDSRRES